MMTNSQTTEGTICLCESESGKPKTYYIWSCSSDDKQKVQDVVEVYVTKEAVVFEKASRETVFVPRDDVFMVTCEICSAPPCS